MTKRVYWKVLFISLLSIPLPLVAGILDYSKYNIVETIGANLFFIACFTVILAGNDWIRIEVKNAFRTTNSPFIQKGIGWFISVLYNIVTCSIIALAWLKISNSDFKEASWFIFLLTCMLLITVYNLIIALFLSRKRHTMEFEAISTTTRPEEQEARTTLLRNDLDPHFIFNSLTTLSHLIMHEAPKAHEFNNRLSSVYKYFLLNKHKELISLSQELEFIENYFFVLQIRHDNKVQMKVDPAALEEKSMIPPCALQILVDNALKHNEYTENDPLEIKINVNSHFLKVTNNIKPKPYLVNSNRIGLNNLNSRYQLICHKNIEIENSVDQFVVKLPLIRK